VKTIQPAAPGQGNLLPVSATYLAEHRETLVRHGVPVYEVLKGSSGAFRAESYNLAQLPSVAQADRHKPSFLIDREWKARIFSATDSFEAQLEPLRDQSPEQRSQAVRALKTVLTDLKAQESEPLEKARVIMDTVGQAFLLNKASLKIKPLEVGPHEKALARDTESVVSTALEFADEPGLVAGLFAGFESLSNGQTVNHVMRVFSSYTGFLQYYNQQHQHRLAQTVRHLFPGVYKPLYRKILPQVDEHLMVSDHLLQLSLLDKESQREYALGAFLHDIGKMANLDYFESDAAYDPVQIRQHVYLSAGLILMNYGTDHDGARLLAGDHHNALGHPGGYGVTRLEREKGLRKGHEPVRVLSNTEKGFVSGESLGWLPIEMLAVADVYDAMVDNSRSYKKALTPTQAVEFLEDTMAAQGKLDPVLVDLFIDYLRSQGLEIPEGRGLAFKAKSF
jgi:hypothetical protein